MFPFTITRLEEAQLVSPATVMAPARKKIFKRIKSHVSRFLDNVSKFTFLSKTSFLSAQSQERPAACQLRSRAVRWPWCPQHLNQRLLLQPTTGLLLTGDFWDIL